MDFFASQDRARASTGRLTFFYILALLGVIVSLNLIAGLIFGVANNRRSTVDTSSTLLGHVGIFFATTLCILTLVTLATLFKKLQIGGDGAKVAELMGGREITATPSDLNERKFINVVEEMSLASGVAKPRLFVMDQENAINAFAAGTRPEAAVVCVTRGSLEQLSRDELQGVIAHEFSHILNGDMRINLRLIALNFGIMAIGYIGLQILRFSSGSNRSSNRNDKDNGAGAILLFGIAMMIIGYIGFFFGKMLQAAVSRQREYLADASAVQFTRNPLGITNALKKIGGIDDGATLASSHADEASHMFFADGVTGFLDSLFATHPPLQDRIHAIDPSFTGDFASVSSSSLEQESSAAMAGFAASTPAALPVPPPLPRAGQAIAARPADLSAARSVIAPAELSSATATLDALPDRLLEAARDPYSARALALSLMLDAGVALRASQLELLARADPAMAKLAESLWSDLSDLGPAVRLPLLDLSLPALRQLSPTQRAQFRSLLQACADADGQLSAFELAVARVLDDQLPASGVLPKPMVRFISMSAVIEPAAVVLSALASAGGAEQADAAFAAGAARLGVERIPARTESYDAAALGRALDALRDASPAVQKRMVDAAAFCVAADRVVRIEEIELMRALCAAMAVPIPPFLEPA